MSAKTDVSLLLTRYLKEVAKERTEIDTAQLQMIDLDEIQSAFGPRWPTVKARVVETALGFLKNRVAPCDLIIPCRNGFILIFGELEGQAAEIAGLDLTRLLNEFFLGEDGFRDFKFKCQHRMLEMAGVANLVSSLSDTQASVPQTGTATEAPEASPDFRFQPVWDVKREAIATYFTAPVDNARANHSIRRTYIAEDLGGLQTALNGLRVVLGAGQRVIIGIRVHSATLADKSHRSQMLEALGRIDSQLRPYLLVKLSDIAPGFPRFHLDEQVQLLAQKIERVGIGLNYDNPQFDQVQHPSIWSCAYDMPPYTFPLIKGVASSIADKLKRDARHAHQAGKRLALNSTGGADVLRLCQAAEIDYVSALALLPLTDAPRGAERLSSATLLAQAS